MRVLSAVALLLALGLAAAGCAKKSFDGPTVDAFHGRLTHDGKAVSFPAEERVLLELFHEKAQSIKIPIQPDGTFQIGWMPVGKYAAALIRESPGGKAGPRRHGLPDGLTIVDGKTEYTIELGKNWKP